MAISRRPNSRCSARWSFRRTERDTGDSLPRAGQRDRRENVSPAATINGQINAPERIGSQRFAARVVVAGEPVGPEHDEVVQAEQQGHRGGLVQQREHADAQLQLVREEGDDQERERVLAEHEPAQRVEDQPGEPRVAEPRDAAGS